VRIAFVELSGQGGLAHHAFQFCRGLAHAGAKVTLITRDDYELAMLCAPFRIEQTVRVSAPRARPTTLRAITRRVRYLQEWLRVVRRLEELRPDAVFLNQVHLTADYFPLLGVRRHAPLLAHIVRDPWDGSAADSRRRFYALFDILFTHEESSRAAICRQYAVAEERTLTIPRGNGEIFSELADPTFTPAALRKQLALGDEVPVILYFGKLAPHKGVDLLLHAFARVHERTGAALVIAGRPQNAFDLNAHVALAQEHGLGNRVVWVADSIPAEHVVAWMQLASVVALPDREPCHNGALAIAQTYGAPIVASDLPSTRDVVEDGVSGLLAPAGNPDAWSDALCRLLDDRPLAQRLGAQGAANAHTRASWDGVGHTILERLRARGTEQRRRA
jgi:glycosyltransferase involved in cell wall biosynthesis